MNQHLRAEAEIPRTSYLGPYCFFVHHIDADPIDRGRQASKPGLQHHARAEKVKGRSGVPARHSMGLMVNDLLQKAMPPFKCCINADADFFRRLLDGQAALHALGISLELLFVPEP
jgi:hypothetical protein